MSIDACVDKVRAGDPDRFLVAMAAPVPVRRVLFPIFAFCLEVARAPWVTEEAMIAEMRLQWWRDALEELGGAGQPRRHEVVDALAEVLPPEAATLLDACVAARRWDIYRDAFEDADHFREYLIATGARPLQAAALALGEAEDELEKLGYTIALSRFLQAIPELVSLGRIPLVDGRAEAVAALAQEALSDLPRLKGPARAIGKEVVLARPILGRAARQPARVSEGRLALSDFGKRWRLLLP